MKKKLLLALLLAVTLFSVLPAGAWAVGPYQPPTLTVVVLGAPKGTEMSVTLRRDEEQFHSPLECERRLWENCYRLYRAGVWQIKDWYGNAYDFRDAGALRLDRIEEDLIWADCLYRGGYRQKLAFDRGTLVQRELVVLSEEGEVLGSNCYDYTQEPDFRFLDSWDEALREVTVTWESFNGQEPTRYTETVSIPADWEYLPYEVRWGDYTAYNNEDYIGEYEYPGDSLDYELFLTTAKG